MMLIFSPRVSPALEIPGGQKANRPFFLPCEARSSTCFSLPSTRNRSSWLAPPTYHCTRAGGSSPARARFVFLFLRRTPRHKYVFCPSIHFYVYFVNQRVHFSQCARPRLTSCLANSYQEYLFAVIFALCFWRRGCSARQRGNALFHES
jgi:hypothetical protein